jgi:hypothetical protein
VKVKLPLIAAALVAFASAGYCQGFISCLYETDQILTTRCEGTVPLPDGTPVLIYWDANSNGPDPADVLAPLCDAPPDCPTGPPGTHNLNTFPLNGEAVGMPGGFLSDPCFLSVARIPSPARYYLVISYLDVEDSIGYTVRYISNVLTFTVPGVPQDFETGPWTCTERDTSLYHCVPDLFTYFVPNPEYGPQTPIQDDCADVCTVPGAQAVHRVCVGPVVASDCYPHLWVTVGCDPTDAECDSACEAAYGWSWAVHPEGWAVCYPVMINDELYYCADLVAGPDATNGCVCITFDFVGPVDVVTPSFENGVVENYALYQNYPNPFNPTTRIVFDVKEANPVTLTIYNAMGQEVARVLNGACEPGRWHVDFDASNLASDLYFYTVKIGNEFTATKKMLLMR